MGEREIDGRSDLYSLGVVGYQMLSGELPFNASSTPALLVKHISERPTPVDVQRPDAPPDLARAVMMLLEKEPANRFPSAAALVVALDTGNVPELPESSFGHDAQSARGDRRRRRESRGRAAELVGVRLRRRHGRRAGALARRASRRVPQEARAVLRGERGGHGARDLRRAQPAWASSASGACISRISTPSSGPTASTGATCSSSRATGCSSTSSRSRSTTSARCSTRRSARKCSSAIAMRARTSNRRLFGETSGQTDVRRRSFRRQASRVWRRRTRPRFATRRAIATTSCA